MWFALSSFVHGSGSDWSPQTTKVTEHSALLAEVQAAEAAAPSRSVTPISE